MIVGLDTNVLDFFADSGIPAPSGVAGDVDQDGDAVLGDLVPDVQAMEPAEFAGQKVVVVGGGNSGAQIAADLVGHTDLTWMTRRPPRYLPDEIDGKALFDIATRRAGGVGELGDIVAVPPVRRDRYCESLVGTTSRMRVGVASA